MKKETQDRLWAILSKNEREELRKAYATPAQSHYSEGYDNARNCYFGHHNLTSDTEPQELLFVERKKVQEEYESYKEIIRWANDGSKGHKDKIRGKEVMLVLDELFGDKCLPDKEPSVQVEPKFKVGQLIMSEGKVGRVLEYDSVREFPYLIHFPFNNSKDYRLESDLQPYTEPSNVSDNETMNETKDNMEEKELDIYELLESCGDVEQIYSVIHDAEVDFKLSNGYIEFIGLSYYSNGSMYDVAGRCMLYPSRALYEKYPLDAYSAWMEWKSERTPKRWRAEQNKEFYYFLDSMLILNDIVDSYDYFCNNRYKAGNYFRTKEEAQQAAEAVRKTLEEFHAKHTEK